MSNDVRTYSQVRDGQPLLVTAFVGGEVLGKAVQFTIGSEYAELSEAQIRDLIKVLQARLDGGLKATDVSDEVVVYNHGGSVVKRTPEHIDGGNTDR